MNIKEIEERLQKATPGPWIQTRPNGEYVINSDGFNVCMTRRQTDADFIAHAHEDISALLTEVKRQREAFKGAEIIANSAGQTIRELQGKLSDMTAERDKWKTLYNKAVEDIKVCHDVMRMRMR